MTDYRRHREQSLRQIKVIIKYGVGFWRLHPNDLRVVVLMKNTFRSIGRSAALRQFLAHPGAGVGGIMTIMARRCGAVAGDEGQRDRLPRDGLNNSLRTGMDLMIRDMLQVGSGLPTGHYILVPVGDGFQLNLPGPPGTAYKSNVGDVDLNAVNPGTQLGPFVNQIGSTACTVASATCVKTDMLTTLAADSTFNDVALTARAADGSYIDVNPAVNIRSGSTSRPRQLMMLEKGSRMTAAGERASI